MGVTATEAGYRGGGEWLDALLGVIEDNYTFLTRTLRDKAPAVRVTPLEGTYLALLDLRDCMPAEQVHDFMIKDCKLAVDYGEQFGDGYEGMIRLNLATDPMLVKQAAWYLVSALRQRGETN